MYHPEKNLLGMQFSPCAFCVKRNPRIVKDNLGAVVVNECQGQPIKVLKPDEICLRGMENSKPQTLQRI